MRVQRGTPVVPARLPCARAQLGLSRTTASKQASASGRRFRSFSTTPIPVNASAAAEHTTDTPAPKSSQICHHHHPLEAASPSGYPRMCPVHAWQSTTYSALCVWHLPTVAPADQLWPLLITSSSSRHHKNTIAHSADKLHTSCTNSRCCCCTHLRSMGAAVLPPGSS